MKELLKWLISELNKKPFAKEILFVVSLLVLDFFLFEYFLQSPPPLTILENSVFRSSVLAVLSGWIISLTIRKAISFKFRVVLVLFVSVACVTSIYWIINQERIVSMPVRVVVDNTSELSASFLQTLAGVFDSSPLFSFESSDYLYPIEGSDPIALNHTEIRNNFQLHRLLRSQEHINKEPLTVLVTRKRLDDDVWSNLYMITWPDGAVLSLFDIAKQTEEYNLLKYIASSIAVQTIASYSLIAEIDILGDRTSSTIRGCMFDFHRTKDTYYQMTQSPNLCAYEKNVLNRSLGKKSVVALENIFTNIRNLENVN